MNCDDLSKALIEGSIASWPASEAQDHLNNCEQCRALVAVLSQPVSEAPHSSATFRRIERELATGLHPVRPIAAKGYLLASFGAIFLCVVALGVYRIGPFALEVMSLLQGGGILSTLAITAALLALSLANQMVPGSLHRVPPSVLPLAATISLAILIVVLFPFQHERDFWAKSWSCLRAGTPIGVLAAFLSWFVLRRGAVLSPRTTGALTGLFAGLVGTTVLEIHCPILDAGHILLSHLGIAVLGATAGLVFGWAAENDRKFWRRP